MAHHGVHEDHRHVWMRNVAIDVYTCRCGAEVPRSAIVEAAHREPNGFRVDPQRFISKVYDEGGK